MNTLTNSDVKTLVTEFTKNYYKDPKVSMLYLAPLASAKLNGQLTPEQVKVFLKICKDKMRNLIDKGIMTASAIDLYTTKVMKSNFLERHKSFKQLREEELLLSVHGVAL